MIVRFEFEPKLSSDWNVFTVACVRYRLFRESQGSFYIWTFFAISLSVIGAYMCSGNRSPSLYRWLFMRSDATLINHKLYPVIQLVKQMVKLT